MESVAHWSVQREEIGPFQWVSTTQIAAVSSAQLAAEFRQHFETAQAASFEFGGWHGDPWARWRIGAWTDRGWAKLEPADAEVFLEAIGLQEIGEFQRPYLTAGGPDFALEITDQMLHVGEGVTGAQDFVPQALPVVTQRQGLPREPAIQPVGLSNQAGIKRRIHARVPGC